jgi:galactose mutarotase-like enzyme
MELADLVHAGALQTRMIRYARLVGLSAAALMAAVSAGSSANVARVETPQLVQLVVPGGKLRAFIDPAHGAELAGLEVLHDSRWSELLYRGLDDRPTDGWSGKAPILWPAVGRNFVGPPRDNHFAWALHGSIYPMAIHGFARDQSWRLVGRGRCDASSYLKLVLRANSRTRRSYPFGFELATEYRLWRDSLYIRQSVRSDPANSEGMPFSIGNHITLRVPLVPGSEPGLTTVSTPASAQVITDAFGRPTGQVVPVDYAQPRRLDSLLASNPISLSRYPAGQVWVRVADPSGFAVTIGHSEDQRPQGVPVLFNLWGDVGQGFFAPEPWVGKQNSLASGDGVIRLAPGDEFQWTIVVEISSGKGAPAARYVSPAAPSCSQ